MHGSGQPLLFVPGWTMDHTVFLKQKEYFQKTHRVILFDPPGCGSSSRFERYDFSLYVNVLKAFVEHLDLRELNIVAWSMGGEIAIRYCAAEQGRIQSLSLVCSTPSFIQRDEWQHGMQVPAAKRFLKGLSRDPAATFSFFRKEVLVQVDQDNTLEEILIKAGIRTDLKMAQDMFSELMVQDVRPLLPRLNVPVYVIGGVHDAVCRPEASEFMSEHIPGAALTMMDAGHVPFLSSSDLFNNQLHNYISKKH